MRKKTQNEKETAAAAREGGGGRGGWEEEWNQMEMVQVVQLNATNEMNRIKIHKM